MRNYIEEKKKLKNGGIIVNQALASAVKEYLNNRELKMKDLAIKYEIGKKTLIKKVKAVENYKKEQQRNSRELLESKHYPILLKTISKIKEHLPEFPEKISNVINSLSNGAPLIRVVTDFHLNTLNFKLLMGCLRKLSTSRNDHLKTNISKIRDILPKLFNKENTIDYFEGFKAIEPNIRVNQLSESRTMVTQPSSNTKKKKMKKVVNKETTSALKNEEGLLVYRKPVIRSTETSCSFCHLDLDNEEDYGRLHYLKKIAAHYYCVLFSSNLEQNGEDEEGIQGFLAKDLIKELKRGIKLKCVYCLQKGATIGCSVKTCKKTYHYPCGIKHGSQFCFQGNFSSYCSSHREFQMGKLAGTEVCCPICSETLIAGPEEGVWPPCCKPDVWFHRICIKKMALNAGLFHFKCLLCNNADIFKPAMQDEGVFIPDRDASWELEEGAFREMEISVVCSAENCLCPDGRDKDDTAESVENSQFEVIMCSTCGSNGIHYLCGKLKLREWTCGDCAAVVESLAAPPTKRKRPLEDPSAEGPSDKKIRLAAEEAFKAKEIKRIVLKYLKMPSLTPTIVIKDVLEEGTQLNQECQVMHDFVETLGEKLSGRRGVEKALLGSIIKHCDRAKFILSEQHISKFFAKSLNLDQMRVLKTIFVWIEQCKQFESDRKFELRVSTYRNSVRKISEHLIAKKQDLEEMLSLIQLSLVLEGNSVLPSVDPMQIEDEDTLRIRYSDYRKCVIVFDNVKTYYTVRNPPVLCLPEELAILKKCTIPLPKSKNGNVVRLDSPVVVKTDEKVLLDDSFNVVRLDSPVVVKTDEKVLLDDSFNIVMPVKLKTPSKKLKELFKFNVASQKENNGIARKQSFKDISDVFSNQELKALSEIKTPMKQEDNSPPTEKPKSKLATLDFFVLRDSSNKKNNSDLVTPKKRKRSYHKKKDDITQKTITSYFMKTPFKNKNIETNQN